MKAGATPEDCEAYQESESTGEKVFFAGEATNFNGHLATVHGAMESGYRACKEILES
jgi:monoamine oxidase